MRQSEDGEVVKIVRCASRRMDHPNDLMIADASYYTAFARLCSSMHRRTARSSEFTFNYL
jgi:hypothetical protein